MVANEGFEVAFHGEFGEIVPNDRIVTTEVYEMPQGDPQAGSPEAEAGALNIITFAEVNGRTTLTTVVECPSKEVRDAIIDSGMEGGMQEAMDELEQVAVSLR
jgi:uncharacterized protein YndB with AHSA1/START domain